MCTQPHVIVLQPHECTPCRKLVLYHRRHWTCRRLQLPSARRSTHTDSSVPSSPLSTVRLTSPHPVHPKPTPTHIATPSPQAAAELQPLCQSLPQLLHHRAAVLRILLSALVPAARLSLPALLDLLASAARDLQAEFLPALPRVVRRLVGLLDGGADREPEVSGSAWRQRCFWCVEVAVSA